MMNLRRTPGMAASLAILGVLFLCTSYAVKAENDKEEQLREAMTTPFGRYPDTITYTLGKLTGANNSNMPEGDTYEDNAYTRYLKEMLNVQNRDVFEGQDSQYAVNLSLAMASGDLPDIMVVSSEEDLQSLVEEDLIEDLSESFRHCMTDTIYNIYASYDGSMIDSVTFDGRIMAIPETNIADGPNLLWLRRDWMDSLGLEAPKTLEDAENIVAEFIKQDPGNNGEGKTIGFICDPSLSGECGYSSEYQMDIVFAGYGAYPKQWIYDGEGRVSYGSVQPEAFEALKRLNSMYEKGLIDPYFLLHTSTNNIEMVVNGQCGSFFGPWWAPNNPLMMAMEKNPDAVWEPFLLETAEDGSTSFYSQNPTYKYIVVRKGYEHPEIACKIVSVLFDYIRYNETENEEFKEYYKINVDPTARPLAINLDFRDALTECYRKVTAALQDSSKVKELGLLEYSYYEACQAYLDDPYNAGPEEWAAYTSRITACSLLYKAELNEVESLFFDETKTMSSQWWKLQQLEKNAYLQMVTGEISREQFDDFVNEWYASGGEEITGEVRKAVEKKGDS